MLETLKENRKEDTGQNDEEVFIERQIMVARLLFGVKPRTSVLNAIDMAEADKLTELNGLVTDFYKSVTRTKTSKGNGSQQLHKGCGTGTSESNGSASRS